MKTHDTPAAKKSGHVEVNGVNYYYEIHGAGRAAAASARRPRLDRHVRAGAADPRREAAGDRRRPARPRPHHARRPPDQPDRHGRRHWRRCSKQLGYGQVDVVRLLARRAASRSGWRCSIRRSVRRLVIASGRLRAGRLLSRRCCRSRRRSAPAMADMMKDTPMYKSYVAVAPNPADFPKLLDRMGELMRDALQLGGRRQEAEDAGDAGLRRQRHVPARAHRRVLPAARRRPAETPAGCARTCRRTGSRSCPISPTTRSSRRRRWRKPCCRSSTARAARRAGPSRCSRRSSRKTFLRPADDARVPERERGRHFEHGPPWSYKSNVPDGSSRGTTTTFRHSTSARSATRSRSCLVRKQTAPLTSRNSKPNPLAARLIRLSQIGHHRAP